MARINVEESVFRDPRFYDLCAKVGSVEAGLGTLVLAWDASQRSFWKGKNTVPVDDLRTKLKHFQALLDCGLARMVEDAEVYVVGSEAAFEKLRKRRAAGSLGGQKSAEVRGKKKKRSNAKQTQANEANSSNFNPSTSTSTSKLDFPSGNSARALELPKVNPIALWCGLYKFYLGTTPDLLEQDKGKLLTFGKTRSEEKLRTLFSCYFQIQKQFYKDRGYPVGVFFADLQSVVRAAETGIDPTKPESFDTSKLKD